jgi:uncharacterized protein with WD repeat
MDVEAIRPGVDFPAEIRRAVNECDVLLVIIGPQWARAMDEQGQRRLDNPDDWVVEEIRVALQRGIPVIPVLVDGAPMPRRDELPAAVTPLASRQEFKVRFESFTSDADGLVSALEAVLGATASSHVSADMVFVPDPQILRVHQYVTAVAISPDGTRLATGDSIRVRMWDLRTGFTIWQRKISVISSPIKSVAFSPDGYRLAASGDHKVARIWDAATGMQQLRIGHNADARAVAFSPDGTRLATGGGKRAAQIWDATTGKQQLLVNHAGLMQAVAFGPNGRRLTTASMDGTVRIWDAATGEQQVQINHTGGVWAIALSPDGARFATGGLDGSGRIWDAVTGEKGLQVNHSGAVLAVAFSPDGSRLATGGLDKTSRVWDAGTGQEQAHINHAGGVSAVAFSPDGSRLVTGSMDKTARIWDATRS